MKNKTKVHISFKVRSNGPTRCSTQPIYFNWNPKPKIVKSYAK